MGAMVLAPGALIGGGIWYLGEKHADIKDSENINKEFNRRRLSTFTLANNATINHGKHILPDDSKPKCFSC